MHRSVRWGIHPGSHQVGLMEKLTDISKLREMIIEIV